MLFKSESFNCYMTVVVMVVTTGILTVIVVGAAIKFKVIGGGQ